VPICIVTCPVYGQQGAAGLLRSPAGEPSTPSGCLRLAVGYPPMPEQPARPDERVSRKRGPGGSRGPDAQLPGRIGTTFPQPGRVGRPFSSWPSATGGSTSFSWQSWATAPEICGAENDVPLQYAQLLRPKYSVTTTPFSVCGS
jgi:hypothetical protein